MLYVSLWCRYRNLIERALQARLVYGSPNMNRAVSFEYMNRQLVWNEFSVNFFITVDLTSILWYFWDVYLKFYVPFCIPNKLMNIIGISIKH